MISTSSTSVLGWLRDPNPEVLRVQQSPLAMTHSAPLQLGILLQVSAQERRLGSVDVLEGALKVDFLHWIWKKRPLGVV